ncbi:hypothetical protein [Paenibacillus sp. Soil522]|uniref:hypothetical protein n=1 Tax=Paenibacillus sp. Soil522 TaxID=1736388 RepID=UPI0006F4A74A|nr:hypothetical protein [Paenibacillus sp. Soil522]KRE44862.1 hypothetical protein ASG81_14320 [Paenibacillus sp. Soil522]
MRNIEIRPNLKTAGGEFSDIMVGGRFAGTLALVYREGDRITGSVQLEKDSLKPTDKHRVESYLKDYIQSFIHAVRAETCDVVMTFSRYDHIVTMDQEDYEAETEEYDPRDQSDYSERQPAFISEEDEDSPEDWESAEYELVMVNKKRNRIEYHIYDNKGKWIAEAILRTDHADISGDVRWVFEPDDNEVQNITELLVTDFDEETIDTFMINHKFDGELLETVELTHEDLLDTPIEEIGDIPKKKDYSVILARDDGDVLTYEIYQQSAGKLPIGTATVNIEHRRLTGFIDFRHRSNVNNAEVISSLLMQELDKEKDYSGLNLSLMFKNELVDELIFDNEPVH